MDIDHIVFPGVKRSSQLLVIIYYVTHKSIHIIVKFNDVNLGPSL